MAHLLLMPGHRIRGDYRQFMFKSCIPFDFGCILLPCNVKLNMYQHVPEITMNTLGPASTGQDRAVVSRSTRTKYSYTRWDRGKLSRLCSISPTMDQFTRPVSWFQRCWPGQQQQSPCTCSRTTAAAAGTLQRSLGNHEEAALIQIKSRSLGRARKISHKILHCTACFCYIPTTSAVTVSRPVRGLSLLISTPGSSQHSTRAVSFVFLPTTDLICSAHISFLLTTSGWCPRD